jgi:hypothetical protein
MYTGLRVKYRYSCQILRKLEFYGQIFEKWSNMRFHENSSSWSRVVIFGRTDGWTNMTNLTVGFRNFAKAPKNWSLTFCQLFHHHVRHTVTYQKYYPNSDSQPGWKVCGSKPGGRKENISSPYPSRPALRLSQPLLHLVQGLVPGGKAAGAWS